MFDLSREKIHLNGTERATEIVLISRLMKNINRMYEYHFGFYYDYQKYTSQKKKMVLYNSLINIYNLVHLTVVGLGFDPDKFVKDAVEKLESKKEEFEKKDSIFKKCKECVSLTKDVHSNLYCMYKKEYIENIDTTDDCK